MLLQRREAHTPGQIPHTLFGNCCIDCLLWVDFPRKFGDFGAKNAYSRSKKGITTILSTKELKPIAFTPTKCNRKTCIWFNWIFRLICKIVYFECWKSNVRQDCIYEIRKPSKTTFSVLEPKIDLVFVPRRPYNQDDLTLKCEEIGRTAIQIIIGSVCVKYPGKIESTLVYVLMLWSPSCLNSVATLIVTSVLWGYVISP